MKDTTIEIGRVVAWPLVPDGALVRDALGWLFLRRHGEAAVVFNGVRVYTPEYDMGWHEAHHQGEPTIIALGLTGQESANELVRLAEVFEVREALADINWPAWPFLQADIAVVFNVTDAADLAKRLAERLHAAGWRPHEHTAEDAARLLDDLEEHLR